MSALEITPRPANKVDDLILTHADSHSPEEISQLLNGAVSPARVASHTQRLLKSRNWLTEAQQELVLMWKLRKWLLELEQKHMDVDNAKLRLTFVKTIMDQLGKRRAATETDLNTLYGNQGKLMGMAFDIALAHMAGALREQIDPVKWAELKKEGLAHAQAELAKYEIES